MYNNNLVRTFTRAVDNFLRVCARARGAERKRFISMSYGGGKELWYSLVMSDELDDQDFRGWRFEPQPSREAVLERRVKELENTVARLEREIRAKNHVVEEPRNEKGIHTLMGTIGQMRGVLPVSPYKAD